MAAVSPSTPSTSSQAVSRVDVLVIGAGQAGLATARELASLGLRCTVHERHARIGDSWRRRFDSLTLFSPRSISSLPDVALPGDRTGLPHKNEIGDHLEGYAHAFALPVVTASRIRRLTRTARGFVAEPEGAAAVEARAVVVATGAFQRPSRPDFAAALDERVQQLDAETYRNPRALSAEHVVVVGDGATGRQIALELVRSRKVVLATGRWRSFLPQRTLGIDSTVMALRLGLLTADKRALTGRLLRALDATPGLHLRKSALARRGVRIVPRCVGAGGDAVTFADGSRTRCDAVIWAAGYRDDTAWMDIEGAATPGRFVEDRGISPVPGLYYVGREWQRCRASGLICGVHRDARYIADRLKTDLA